MRTPRRSWRSRGDGRASGFERDRGAPEPVAPRREARGRARAAGADRARIGRRRGRYGARLVADFQALDDRIASLASSLGVDPARPRHASTRARTPPRWRANRRISRGSPAARGDDFDRQFWVIVAQDQLAATDMLLPVAGADPRLEPIVAEFGRAARGVEPAGAGGGAAGGRTRARGRAGAGGCRRPMFRRRP